MRAAVLALLVAAAAAAPASADLVTAREHFFGPENVDAGGAVRADRVILSWFSVASMAMAIDGHVVLLDTYIHKGEAEPAYVPTTTAELVELDPDAIFVGHGHFDHANTVGEIAARTGATVIGAPEHCDQTRTQVEAFTGEPSTVPCVEVVDRAAPPGQVREVHPLGPDIAVTVLKHIHSAAVAPDGEGHETSVLGAGLPDANQILLHPPGPGTISGLASGGDEGATLLYQFRVRRFSLTWHDSVGPLREEGPQVFDALDALPPTDVELGSTLGFNDPTNGQRDPVDYMVHLRPAVFFPLHHDFIAEYGVSKSLEGVFRRELAKREPVPTEVRWLYDPQDYIRPSLMTFDVQDDVVARAGEACLRGRPGRAVLGRRPSAVSRVAPLRATRRAVRWCVQGSRGALTAVLGDAGRATLIASTARAHGLRGVRPGDPVSAARRQFPHARRAVPGVWRVSRHSAQLVGVRAGRVRFVGVAAPALLRRPRALAAAADSVR